MTQVHSADGTVIAARKTMILQDAVRINEDACQQEFERLKVARALNASNVLHALQPKITCLLDTSQADRQAVVIFFDMEVGSGVIFGAT